MYNTTPYSTTKTPTEAFHGFAMRSKIPRLTDNVTAFLSYGVEERDFLLKERGRDIIGNLERHTTESRIER